MIALTTFCFTLLIAVGFSFPGNTVEPVVQQFERLFGADINQTQHAKKGDQVCMGELGCFKITPDFVHLLYRPINALPNDRVTINTRFHLYTKYNPKEYYDLQSGNSENIKKSPLNGKFPTKFIVHGFVDSKLYGKWMEELKDNLLLYGQFNVIVVDWSGGNGPPYTQATANTRVVGAEIALLIQKLKTYKSVNPMDCHIIGHSLGAHIAGYAGKRLNKLGRISGADPAEPYFQNMPTTVRLDSTDADFVDVIHTDSKSILLLGLGMSQAVGHIDFFPNDGKSQPGCSTHGITSIFTDGLIEAGRRFVSCNHQRSVDFYIYSINYASSLPVGFECKSWTDFVKGYCADCGKDGSKCAIMGLKADHYKPLKKNGVSKKFYLQTGPRAPYWISQYQLSVKLFKPKSFTDQKGKLSLVINGATEITKVDVTPKDIDLVHGSTYNFLFKANKDLGTIKSVTFSWKSAGVVSKIPIIGKIKGLISKAAIYVENVTILPMNMVIKSDDTKKTAQKFCGNTAKAIGSGENVSMNKCT